MPNTNYKNEEIKRSFLEHLKYAKGFVEGSLDSFAEAVSLWETFSEYEDFSNFSKSKAIDFIKWMKVKETKTKLGILTIVTQYNYLRRIKKFFMWLSDQPGYKNKVLKNNVEFLRLPNNEVSIATAGTTRLMPTFEEVKKIIDTIEVKNEIDRRDRALISFALITGMRISAIITLKMKNFNERTKEIYQNPGDGVKTKASKKILSTFFPIGWNEPEKYVMEWIAYLKSKNYEPDDPIFPSTSNKPSNEDVGHAKEFVTKKSWCDSGGARKIFVKRCADAKVSYFNPHSFRHLIVHMMSEIRLTEKEKRAISLCLGHENVGTTFGSYGYGNISDKDATKIVREIQTGQDSNGSVTLSSEEKESLDNLLKKLK